MSTNTSTESKSTYSLFGRAKNLINSKSLSDICFLVGESDNAKKIYGHKLFLAMGSPVFEKMFFGDLPEKKDLIVIPELTAAGFMNIIRYIYAEQVGFELHELCETYMAANMFMVYDLCDIIRNNLIKNQNEKNRILIYEQLIKIRVADSLIDDDLLDSVRSSIKESSFNNEYFNKISEEVLIDILNIECLDVEEALILKSCFNWINESKSTIEDKKASFEKIKPYINFSRITFEDLKLFTEIDSFLNPDEIGNLVMFLMDKKNKPYPFELKKKKKFVLSFNFSPEPRKEFRLIKGIYSIDFSVNRDILIKSIETSMPVNKSLGIRFFSDEQTINPICFETSRNDKLTLVFPKLWIIKANLKYRIKFDFDIENLMIIGLNDQDQIEYEEINFSIKIENSFSFIKKIKFFKR